MMAHLSRWRWPLLACFIVGLSALLTLWRYQLPNVAPPSADGFSAQQAMDTLRTLLPNDTPHPRGSDEHRAVVQRLVDELETLGLTPERQVTEACSPYGPCGMVENVLVHFQGESPHIILLSAHTDSVPTAPGAGDDGQGVAILVEMARYLNGKTLAHPVTLLFTDGEEDGLYGASAFATKHPSASAVAVIINVEARGQTGLSSLFRTAGDNYWLIDTYARWAPSPFSSSIHQVVFETMPNATDLTVFEAHGMSGVDFAFFDGPEHYHRATDTVDNLDPRAVQSQGDNVLAMLKGFLATDLSQPPAGDAHWFDVLGVFVVVWPQPWTPWMTLGITLLVLVSAGVLIRKHNLRFVPSLVSAVLFWVTVIGGGALGWIGQSLLGHAQWPTVGLVFAFPLLWSMALGLAARRIDGRALLLTTVIWLSLLGLLFAFTVPGLAYLFALPAFCGVLFWWLAWRQFDVAYPLLAGLGTLAMAIHWFPLFEGIRIALDIGSVVPISLGLGLCFTGLLPMWRPASSI